MWRLIKSPYLMGPWWIICLVFLMALVDVFRGRWNINLGRTPMWFRTLYLRVFVYEFGAIPDRLWYTRRRVPGWWYQPVRSWYLHTYYSLKYHGRYRSVAGGATLVASRSGLFFSKTPGGLPVIQDIKMFSGNVFFVDVNTDTGGTTSGFGTHPDKAITDIESAYDLCTASQGDSIFVLPGHAETVADEITMDVAGVSVLGQGEGLARPFLTQAFAGDAIAMDAASNVVNNLGFNEATTAPGVGGAAIDMNAAHCRVSNCHFDLGADDLEAITVTATGDFARIEENEFIVTANGPDAAIEVEAVVTDVKIIRNWFNGLGDTEAWDVGGINSASAITSVLVHENNFVFGPAIIFSAAATGVISRNLMGEGTLASMLDPGSCMCFENYEADAIDQSGRLIPTVVAS